MHMLLCQTPDKNHMSKENRQPSSRGKFSSSERWCQPGVGPGPHLDHGNGQLCSHLCLKTSDSQELTLKRQGLYVQREHRGHTSGTQVDPGRGSFWEDGILTPTCQNGPGRGPSAEGCPKHQEWTPRWMPSHKDSKNRIHPQTPAPAWELKPRASTRATSLILLLICVHTVQNGTHSWQWKRCGKLPLHSAEGVVLGPPLRGQQQAGSCPGPQAAGRPECLVLCDSICLWRFW